MNGIGLDCGNSTVKLVMVSQEGRPVWFKSSSHHGDAARAVRLLLGELLQSDPKACGFPVVLTGSAGDRLPEGCPGLSALRAVRRRVRSSRSAVRAPVFSPAWTGTRRLRSR